MTATQPSWEELNAYVDGELPPARAAEIARALAHDRKLAETVAALSKLKATVPEAAETEPLSLPAKPRRRLRTLSAVAASILIAVAVGLALVPEAWRGDSDPAWLAAAWRIHDAWAREAPVGPGEEVGAGVVLAALSRTGTGAYLPDLSSARLTLATLRSVSAPGRSGQALHAGYLGTRGCQVSLLIVPGPATGLPKTLGRFDAGSGRSYAWRTASHGYVLMAEGMDEARLALIAKTVHEASLRNAPFGPETRSALRESRARSQPCLA